MLISLSAYPRRFSMRQIGFALQHGSCRAPSMTKLVADYDDGIVTINVNEYTGSVQAYVTDPQGNVVGLTMSHITNSGYMTMDLGKLAQGNYTLTITLDNATYSGQFDA